MKRVHALRSAAGIAAAGALIAVSSAATVSMLAGHTLHSRSTTTRADTGWNAVPVTPAPEDPAPSAAVLDTGWN
jgi:hypothetical protein